MKIGKAWETVLNNVMGTERKKEGTEEAESRATSKEVKKWKGFWWELAKYRGPGNGRSTAAGAEKRGQECSYW